MRGSLRRVALPTAARHLALLATALGVLGALAGCRPSRETVVLVTVAGLRADAVQRMPVLSSIGRDPFGGSILTPSPETVPALAAMMTGRAPLDLGLRDGDLARVPRGARTLAEELAARGYQTVAVVGGSNVTPISGLARGFVSWRGATDASAGLAGGEATRLGGALPDEAVAAAAAAVLDGARSARRLFLWVHFGELPDAVARGGNPATAAAAYGDGLKRLDGAVRTLLDALAGSGRDERARIAVAGVHGLGLGDGGEVLHGLTLSDAVVKVPVVARGFAAAPGGAAPRSLAALHDLVLGEDSASGGPVLVTTHVPERQYGWPPRAAAAGPEGWLRLDPAARFTPPQGAVLEGDAAWNSAPATLRDRLTKTRFVPDLRAAGPENARVLALMADARRALERRDAPAHFASLLAAADAAPRALAPRAAFLDSFGTLSADVQQRHAADRERMLDEIDRIAGEDAGRTLDAARVLARGGRAPRALERLRRLAAGPLTAGERIAVARALLAAGAGPEGEALVERAVADEPDAIELVELQGDLALNAGNGFRARTAYESVVAVPRGRTAGVLAKLGDALAQLGDRDAALARYAEAAQADPGYRYPNARAADLLIEKGETGAAATALVRSLPETGDAVTDAVMRAQALSSRKLYREATIELERAMKDRANDERLLVNLARVLNDAGARPKAREILEDVLSRLPDSGLALLELARLEALDGHADAAITLLDRAEPHAGPGMSQRVRGEPAFRSGGTESPLARRAAAFQGRALAQPTRP